MTENWKRLGDLAREQRKALGLTQDAIAERGGPSAALIRVIENGRYKSDMQNTVRRGYERALQWSEGSLDEVLRGGDPTKMDDDPKPATGHMSRLSEHVDQAVENLQRAIGELTKAESELDAQVRRLALNEVLRQKIQEERVARESLLGRPLTAKEFLTIDSMERPTPSEIAEMTAWIAMHDSREWTRYEMALIEYVFEDYPEDVSRGSSYADLEPFRERVRRLQRTREQEIQARWGGDGNERRSTASNTAADHLSAVHDDLEAAAKKGDIEGSGEFNT